MSGDPLDVAEFIVGYLAEVDEHLAAARACLVALDGSLKRDESNPKAIRELFRALHTIKGLSAMVGAEPIVDISHELETLLRWADRAAGRLPARALDEIVRGLRVIEDRVASLSRKETLAPAPKQLIDALAALQLEVQPLQWSGKLTLDGTLLARLTTGEQQQLLQGLAKGRRGVRLDFHPSHARAARGLNITSVRGRIAELGDVVKVLPRSVEATTAGQSTVAFALLVLTDASNEALAAIVDAPAEDIRPIEAVDVAAVPGEPELPRDVTEGPGDRTRNFIRVEVARLDRALEGLSALMVTRARVQRAVQGLENGRGTFRDLNTLLADNGRQLRDLRTAVMSARMVPVAEMLERTPLLVRGLSRSSGKRMELIIDAGHSELDKAVADRLSPAIVHLLRNAVDHAIELPEERVAHGKSAEGRLEITCSASSGSHLTLVISDDGRGIDGEKVARRAGTAVPTDDTALLELITRSGLSTLDQATHTSGRGLGMDIVKRIVVDELGGQLRLETTANVGTRFTLTVPLSLTILDAFSFVSAARTFVVPVSAVEDLVEIEPHAVTIAPHPDRTGSHVRLLKHRGTTLPLFTLSALLGLEPLPAERAKAIIARKNDRRFAFQVDKMLSQQEVVVRPLKDALVSVRGVSGSTDLGDGQPTLVLDLLALIDRAVSTQREAP